ncbi:MAG: penicillin-binding protein 2 [Caldilineaceae bacterium]|nr:penicillin-binding protein 2 [Caldilineaceae bacterium]
MQRLSTGDSRAGTSTQVGSPQWGATETTAAGDLQESQARRVWRFGLLALLFVLLTGLILMRLLVYQVFSQESALPNSYKQLTLPPRGTIVDRDGEILAADRFYYEVVATPREIKTDAEREAVSKQLETAIGLPWQKTWSLLAENPDAYYVKLAEKIELQDGQRLAAYINAVQDELGATPLNHVGVRPVAYRYYPQHTLGSHVVGFVQEQSYGRYGIEEYYDSFLNAEGIGLLEKNVQPLDSLPDQTRRFLPSVAGKDLVLTIDRTIQYIIEEELQQGLIEYGAESGSVIVMDPHTGAVLGMTNLPTYDANARDSETVDFSAFMNPSVSALYEPGSIFKVITMAAGLDTGTITPTTIFTDTGYIVVGQRTIYNSSRTASGQVDVTDALARSLNVVTAQVADRVGADDFYRYVRRFGFGERTGVDLAYEVAGLLKSPGHELWSLSDLGTNSFGQGLAVTPLQMINAVCAIANGGTLMRPYIVQARLEDDKVLYTKPTVVRHVISPETAHDLTGMMVVTVDVGNKAARVNGYKIAGKSGTAQIPGPEGYLEDQTIVSFVGFAPADDPAFVLLVKMDRPDFAKSQWASYTAAPVFARIAMRLFEHLNIPPDAVRTELAGGRDGANSLTTLTDVP